MLQRTVRTMAKGGCAVLLSSHDLGAVANVADRIAILDHGRVVFETAWSAQEGAPLGSGLAGRATLEQLYVDLVAKGCDADRALSWFCRDVPLEEEPAATFPLPPQQRTGR